MRNERSGAAALVLPLPVAGQERVGPGMYRGRSVSPSHYMPEKNRKIVS
jgi:hypothetical protein